MGLGKSLANLYSDQDLKDLYYQGYSLVKLAQLCGCSDRKIRTYFIEIGVKFRGRRKRKYKAPKQYQTFKEGELDFEKEIKTRLYK